MRRVGAAGVLAPALLGGLVAIAASLLLRGVTSTRLLAEIFVDASTSTLGPRGFSFLLDLLGPAGKPLLFVSVLLAQLALCLLAWRHQASRAPEELTTRVVVGALEVAAALVAGTVILVTLTDARLGPGTGWFEYGLVTLVCAFLFAGVAGLLTVADAPSAYGEEPDRLRRGLVLGLPMLLVGGLALTVIGSTLQRATGGGIQRRRARGPTVEVTPTEDFYVVSKNLLDPSVNPNSWRLRVGGLTREMLELKYADVQAIAASEQYTTLQCISNEVGGDLMGNAMWKGFPLADLIDRAGAMPSAKYVSFRCEDGYTESIPIEFARAEGVMLVTEMNGAPLSDKHGFPLRLLSPGKYGIKHPKWITEIALIDEEFFGYWQVRGWTQEGRMNTSSRIDVPEEGAVISESPFRIHGVAFAGNRGVSKVEVSTDNGQAWAEAVLQPALGTYTWVLWYYDWMGSKPVGRDTLVARATDGEGEVQTIVDEPPYPAGATGYPRVVVKFELPM